MGGCTGINGDHPPLSSAATLVCSVFLLDPYKFWGKVDLMMTTCLNAVTSIQYFWAKYPESSILEGQFCDTTLV